MRENRKAIYKVIHKLGRFQKHHFSWLLNKVKPIAIG